MWTIFSLYWICYNIASVGFFDHTPCGILVPWPGIEPIPPALEGEALTIGPPGKSLLLLFFLISIIVLQTPFP